MNRDSLAAFWRFTKAELKVAVRRYFMPVRVIAQGMYRIAHDADREPDSGTGTRARPPRRG